PTLSGTQPLTGRRSPLRPAVSPLIWTAMAAHDAAHADGQGIHGAVPDDEGHEGHEGHGRKPGQHAQRTSRRKEMIAERHDAPTTKRCGGSVAATLKSPCSLPPGTTWNGHGWAGRSAAKGAS